MFKEWVNERDYSNQEIINIYNHNPNIKIKELSSSTGKSIGEIYRILHDNNVTPNRLKTKHHSVINFSNFGFGINQIAELTGYTPRNIRYILKMRKNG